jgi:hypothetical protein
MKSILALIEEKQKVYAQLPFFQFMGDQTISPEKRLAFAPCAAPFIMSFADLNKYVLRQEPTEDKIQLILNKHTYEDDFHWQWFLEDMQKLSFDCSLNFNEFLRFSWSDQTQKSRLLTYKLYEYIDQSEPIEKLIILEAVEATSDVLVSITQKVTEKLSSITGLEYKYFGDCHCDAENNHNAYTEDVQKFIDNLYISDKTRNRSICLIDNIFELFSQWTGELLDYAEAYQSVQSLNLTPEKEHILEAA